jgi:hypothetical protein
MRLIVNPEARLADLARDFARRGLRLVAKSHGLEVVPVQEPDAVRERLERRRTEARERIAGRSLKDGVKIDLAKTDVRRTWARWGFTAGEQP